MRNPYQVLGLSPLAGPEEIKSAYRRLAKVYHPDAGTGDAAQSERFHEVTAAYDLLRRKAKSSDRAGTAARRQATRSARAENETKAQSKPQPDPSRKPAGSASSAPPRQDAGTATTESPKKHPAFADMLNNLKSAGKRAFGSRAQDHTYELNIPFLDAVSGTRRRLTLQNGKSLEVHIPAGVEDGQQIRLRGQGKAGLAGREAGDAMVTVTVAPHPVFRREGSDIHIDAAVTLPEAVLGAKITVPTIDGEVTLTVPEGSNSGTVLRLKGKGLTHPPGRRRLGRGDQYVTLSLVLPPKPDDALKDFAATWAAGLAHKPRKS